MSARADTLVVLTTLLVDAAAAGEAEHGRESVGVVVFCAPIVLEALKYLVEEVFVVP